MRNIINFLATFAVLWIGSTFFGEYIQIQDIKTLIIATIFMFVIDWIFSILVGLSALLIPIGIGCITIIPLILAAFVLTPIKLILLSKYLDGFMINSFWTYLALTVILSAFTIDSSKNCKE